MFFGWLRQRRRRRLAAQSFPDTWSEAIEANVRLYATISSSQKRKVRNDVQVLVAEKNWEGCNGLRMTDEIKVTIAAQVAILVLGFEQQYFDGVLSILVYPDAYVAPEQRMAGGGIVMEGKSAREGEAWYRGPVVLSWADVLAGGRGTNRGHNLVFHEFAHQLDMINGRVADGVPALDSAEFSQRWVTILQNEFEKLRHECEHGQRTFLDCYGATNLAEFFAVATEAFFESPGRFQQHHAELYSMLQRYYRQNPRRRR